MASSASIGPLTSSSSSASVRGSVATILRLEGLAVAAITSILYARSGSSWWLFAALWLVPDLSMLGYLHCSCWGARTYNAVHTYLGPAMLVLFALLAGAHNVLPVALIWANHIGVDRMLGYGLKYGEGFGFTHLGRLGKQREVTLSN